MCRVDWEELNALRTEMTRQEQPSILRKLSSLWGKANGISSSKGVLCLYMIFVSSLVLVETEQVYEFFPSL